MGIVRQNVVDDTLHVPRVRTTGHVPVAGSKSVHRRHGIPLNANGEADQEGQGHHHSSTMSTEEETSLRGFMLTKVGPTAVLFVVSEVVNSSAQEERETEPNQGTPCAVEVFVVPNTSLKPSSDLVQSPHGPYEHGTGVPSLSDHSCDDERHDTGEEGTPVADVAVIPFFGGDAQLVNHAHRIEVID